MLPERLRHARLAEACRRRQENELTVAILRVIPAALQQTDLLGATDKWRQTLDNPAIEASSSPAFACDAPQPYRAWNSLEFVPPEVFVVERGAGKTVGQFPDHHGVGRRRGLDPCGQVQCVADGDAFLRRSLADQLADYHQTRGDADPDLQPDWYRQLQRRHRVKQRKSGTNRPFRVILVRFRIAEIDEGSIAHVFGNRTAEHADGAGTSYLKCTNHLAQFFGIELCR
jgi:hypothetical protein